MKVAAVLFLVSALVTGLAPNLLILIIGRIIGGVGVGVASVIAPAYIAEVAPARIRGRLGSLQQLAIVTGIFLSLLVDFRSEEHTSELQSRQYLVCRLLLEKKK